MRNFYVFEKTPIGEEYVCVVYRSTIAEAREVFKTTNYEDGKKYVFRRGDIGVRDVANIARSINFRCDLCVLADVVKTYVKEKKKREHKDKTWGEIVTCILRRDHPKEEYKL